jgi:hypothetical protein
MMHEQEQRLLSREITTEQEFVKNMGEPERHACREEEDLRLIFGVE